MRRLPAERLAGVGAPGWLVGREDRPERAVCLWLHRFDRQAQAPAERGAPRAGRAQERRRGRRNDYRTRGPWRAWANRAARRRARCPRLQTGLHPVVDRRARQRADAVHRATANSSPGRQASSASSEAGPCGDIAGTGSSRTAGRPPSLGERTHGAPSTPRRTSRSAGSSRSLMAATCTAPRRLVGGWSTSRWPAPSGRPGSFGGVSGRGGILG
jgi:hypothetical protein